MTWTPESIEAAVAGVKQRATTDAAFRDLAIADPAAAIAVVAGSRPPDHFKVRCVENDGAHLTLVLPDFAGGAAKLSDDDLEKVAGGMIGKKSNVVSSGGACL